MAELKECPFCRREAKIEYGRDYNVFEVVCTNNNCHGTNGWGDTEEEAIAEWNTRAAEAEPKALTWEELKRQGVGEGAKIVHRMQRVYI